MGWNVTDSLLLVCRQLMEIIIALTPCVERAALCLCRECSDSPCRKLLCIANCLCPQVISAMFFAWLSDKLRKRAIFIAAQSVITLIGLLITAYAPQSGWRYFGTLLTPLFLLLLDMGIDPDPDVHRHLLRSRWLCGMYPWYTGLC